MDRKQAGLARETPAQQYAHVNTLCQPVVHQSGPDPSPEYNFFNIAIKINKLVSLF